MSKDMAFLLPRRDYVRTPMSKDMAFLLPRRDFGCDEEDKAIGDTVLSVYPDF